MKTYELAKNLTLLARFLRKCPDIDLKDLSPIKTSSRRQTQTPEITVNLSTLMQLSRLAKKHWQAYIEDNELPISIGKRDSSRDILGKLLRYLDKNPQARDNLTRQAAKKQTKASPELTKALAFLLDESES